MLIKRDFYINGRWAAPLAPRDYAVIDPSTEDACAVISLGSDADTDGHNACGKSADPQSRSSTNTREDHSMTGLVDRSRWEESRSLGVLHPPCAGPGDAEDEAQKCEGRDAVVVWIGREKSFVERGRRNHADRKNRAAQRAESPRGESGKEGQGEDKQDRICPDGHPVDAVAERVSGVVAIDFS